jgi:hypothetical protein
LKTVKHEFTILMYRFSLSNYHLNLLTRTSKLFTLLVSVAKELIRSWVGVRNTRRHTTQPDSFATRHSGSLLTVARSWMFCRGRPPCLSRVYPVSIPCLPVSTLIPWADTGAGQTRGSAPTGGKPRRVFGPTSQNRREKNDVELSGLGRRWYARRFGAMPLLW